MKLRKTAAEGTTTSKTTTTSISQSEIIRTSTDRPVQKKVVKPIQRTEMRDNIYYQTFGSSNITYVRGGNIEQTKCELELVGVNTEGNMHLAGRAKQIAKTYPDVLGKYRQACQGDFAPGCARKAMSQSGKKMVFLAIWKFQEFGARIEWLEQALMKVVDAYATGKLTAQSISCVKIGCGGGLKWEEVGPLLARYLGSLGIHVAIYIGKKDIAYFPYYNEDNQLCIQEVEAAYIDTAAIESDNL